MEGGAYTLQRKPFSEVASWTPADEARVLNEAEASRARVQAATRPWDITFVLVSVVQAAAYVGKLSRCQAYPLALPLWKQHARPSLTTTNKSAHARPPRL